MVLSPDQQAAADAILNWIQNPKKKEKTLGGLAGTGKTTLIKHLLEREDIDMPGPLKVMAPTGKACDVLRRKGVDADTVHSTIYIATRDPITKKIVFTLRPTIPYSFLIVDEASMVSTDLYNDILSFDIPVLWVGDHGQLEPVGDNPKLMDAPEHRLEKIHRQALGSPIIRFAHALRTDTPWQEPTEQEGLLLLDSETDGPASWQDHAHKADIVIAGWNKTVKAVNEAYRDFFNYTGTLCPGERILCLRNNDEHSVFNGMMATVVRIVNEQTNRIDVVVRCDGETEERQVPMSIQQFGNHKVPETAPRWLTYWTYGYAITCHKAQGSEWEKVLVVDEPSSLWTRERWSYTAATRASKHLTYFR